MKKFTIVVGARPNFMKAAPLVRALKALEVDCKLDLIHTGQHYDKSMSEVFFQELNLPEPNIYLGVGSGSHGAQTGRIMIEIEPVFEKISPDAVVVFGDINSTLAGALVAAKMNVPVVHVEAGLRSFDRRMPEEVNRVLTDSISDCLLTSCRDADVNLKNEGITDDKIHFCGNIMVDSLVEHLDLSGKSKILEKHSLEPGKYICVTLHRPSNVDDPDALKIIMDSLCEAAKSAPVIFPVHPRTKPKLSEWESSGVSITDPMGYLDFLHLINKAGVVLTDSGGIQEETSYLGVPCLTLRENTERPITITQGTNELVPINQDSILKSVTAALQRGKRPPSCIDYWDGKAAERMAAVIDRSYG